MACNDNELRATLRELMPHARDLLAESIRFASTHGAEAEVQSFYADRWRAAGFTVEPHPIPEELKGDPEYSRPQSDLPFEGRHNLVIPTHGPGRSLIVNSHADVVPAEGWQGAFAPAVADGTVRGRGACDAKGQVAAMYLAARAMQHLGIEAEVCYQIVIDEEVGGNGSLALLREGLRADGALVLEPTELRVHPANRGAIWFRFEFEGTPCHMGRKHEGVNALDLAHETMGILYEYEKELIRDQRDQPLFAHYEFPAQVNVGSLHGGEWPSMVCPHAVMEGGVGFLPNRPMQQVKQELEDYVERLGSDELKARYALSFPKLHNDSYETVPDHPFVRACRSAAAACGACDEITGWNVSCDARLFNKVGGMPTVVFGPGSIHDAHSVGEKISMSEVAVAAEMLVRLAQIWCIKSGERKPQGEA